MTLVTYLANSIEKVFLIKNIHWLCLPETAGSKQFDSAGAHQVTSLLYPPNTISHIAAKCNICFFDGSCVTFWDGIILRISDGLNW